MEEKFAPEKSSLADLENTQTKVFHGDDIVVNNTAQRQQTF